MARAKTTADAFNAIAEPRRREILTLLKGQERAVSDIAEVMGMNQPAVSKHLRVLREVGLVYVHPDGKQRRYGLDARGLEPVHGWTGGFEEFWDESLQRLNRYVKESSEGRGNGRTGE
jgi:DNA-binding transcriptional ArsR family regulator